MSLEERDIHEIFEIKKLIGSGSYGTILLCSYKNEYKRSQRGDVVCKRIRCRGIQEVFDAINEVLQLTKLRHPGIVVFYETFRSSISSCDYEEEVFINIVMEFIDGGDLHSKFELERIDESFFIDLLEQIGDALKLLHSRKMTHRDISPGNLMMMRHKERNMFRIVDFGFVKDTGGSNIGGYVGTRCYISPEIAMHQKYDSQVDVFSLGAVCLNLALRKDSMEVWRIVQRSNFRADLRSSLKKREYSEALSEIILDMLEVDPRKRITAEEVVMRVKKLKRMSNHHHLTMTFVEFDYEVSPSIEDDEDYGNHFFYDTHVTNEVYKDNRSLEWSGGNNEEEENHRIQNLSLRTLVRIFKYLRSSIISTVSLVCKNWRIVTLSDSLWKYLYEQKWGNTNLEIITTTTPTTTEEHDFPLLNWRNLYFKRRIKKRNLRIGKYKRQEIITKTQDICFDSCESLLVIGGKTGWLHFCDPVNHYQVKFETNAHHGQAVRAIKIIPEEDIVVTCGDDSALQTWDTKTFRKLDEKRKPKSKRRDEKYLSLYYHRKTRKVFVGDTRFMIVFSLLESSSMNGKGFLVEELKKHLSRHSDGVYSITLSPCGRNLYVRSTSTIRILSINEPYALLDCIRDYQNQVWGFAVTFRMNRFEEQQQQDIENIENKMNKKRSVSICENTEVYVGTISTKNERDLVVYKRVPKSVSSSPPKAISKRRKKKKSGSNPRSLDADSSSSSSSEEKQQQQHNHHLIKKVEEEDNNQEEISDFKYVVKKRFRFRDSGVISNVIVTSNLVILGFTMGSIFVLDRNDHTLPVLWARRVARHIQQIMMNEDNTQLLVLVSRNKNEPFLVLDFSMPLKRRNGVIRVPQRRRWSGFNDIISSATSSREHVEQRVQQRGGGRNNNSFSGGNLIDGGGRRKNKHHRYRSNRFNKQPARRKKKKKKKKNKKR